MLPQITVIAIMQFFSTLRPAAAQVFSDRPSWLDLRGLSPACTAAMNLTLGCPSFLIEITKFNPRLGLSLLEPLCTQDCLSSLKQAQTSITSACTTDQIVYDGMIRPASYIVDRFVYTQALTCMRDPSSGEYCDVLQLKAREQPPAPSYQCSDCILGGIQMTLNSTFGYDENTAKAFNSITASCGKTTEFPWTSPPPEIATRLYKFVPRAPQACDGTYTVQEGDNLHTVAQFNNVSSFGLVSRNGLPVGPTSLTSGSILCLPPKCSISYAIGPKDTCPRILEANPGITLAQLRAWNPYINVDCSNIGHYVGFYMCLSPPGDPIRPSSVASVAATPTPDNEPSSNSALMLLDAL